MILKQESRDFQWAVRNMLQMVITLLQWTQKAHLPSPADNPDHIETVSIDIVEHGNVSVDSDASADYFVPEPNLNYRIPTSQHLLMP